MHNTETPLHTAARLDRLDRIARRMDRAIRLPIIGVRLGWDSILGLIPGVGDAVTLAPAGYIILEGHRLGAPTHVTARMLANVGIDAAIGTIPLIGDVFDIAWKANMRNVNLLRTHFEKVPQPPLRSVNHPAD